MCGRGYILVGLLVLVSILLRQASVLPPLMFIAQDPQIPALACSGNIFQNMPWTMTIDRGEIYIYIYIYLTVFAFFVISS